MLVMSKVTVSRMSKEKAFKVWAIHSTNGFRNGVCIKMSRFNHYFWNADTRTRDYGEQSSVVESREKRRSALRDNLTG